MILGAEPILLRRLKAERGEDGRTVFAVDSERTIYASVQPLTDKQREVLPEGIRARVEKRLYTKSEVKTADQQTGQPADVIIIDGAEFIAVQVKHWRRLLAHYEVDLIRRQEDDV